MDRNEIFTVDENGKLSLHLHHGQTRAWDSKKRFVFVIAGTQGGKTSFGPWWLKREIERCGEGDYLVVTANYDLYKLKLLPEMLKVFRDVLGYEHIKIDKTLYSEDRKTRIILRSADAEAGLESATAKAAWLDECGQDKFRVSAWEAVQRRLSLAQGRVLATTTPYNLGWLKTQVYDRWRKGDSDYQVITFKSIENPAFPIEEYNRAKDTLVDWKFQMFYNGNFTKPAGMIYSDFDDANIVEPFKLPKAWVRYIGVDFGAVNTAVVWFAQDPDAEIYYLYREYLAGGKTTQEHVDEVYRLSGFHKEKGAWVGGENVIEWAGGAKSETQQRMDWQYAGAILSEPVIHDVEAGIDRVIALVKPKRLKVFSNCTGVIDEFGTYARTLGEDGEPTEKIADKETFHRLDAVRYCTQLVEYDRWLIY